MTLVQSIQCHMVAGFNLMCMFVYLLAGVLEVFGSWNKVAPHLESGVFETEVAKQLDDAMNDASSVTIVTSDSVARTGFSPPQDQL